MYLVIYDITDNKIRKKVEIICKDYGLERVQKSAFRGNISLDRKNDMENKFKYVTSNNPQTDIQIYTLCNADAEKIVYISNGVKKIYKPQPENSVLIV